MILLGNLPRSAGTIYDVRRALNWDATTIDTGLLQSNGLVPCGRGADREDALAMTLFEDLLRRNAVDGVRHL